MSMAATQEVSLSGTLKPGMENSECHLERMKSWPRGGYIRAAGLRSGLDCPLGHDRPSRAELPCSQGISTQLGPDTGGLGFGGQ